jgi:hypothetical protein
MELLDRYLNAVRQWLPSEQQEDIIAELGEDIRSQIEERESAIGHKLDEAELAALLKERGHPMLMAGRYMPQRSLIGPVLYPVYLRVLRLVVLWVLIPVFILIVGPIVVTTAADPSLASVKTLWDLMMAAVFAVGIVTLIFAIIERHPIRELENWDPRRLPVLPLVKSLVDARPAPRAQPIAEIILSVVFTGLCLHVMWFRTAFDIGGVHIALAPVWRIAFWPILLIALAGVPLGWVSLVWPEQRRLRSGVRLAINGATLIVLTVLGSAGTWVTLTSSGIPAAELAEAAKWTDFGIRIGLGVAALITLGDSVREARRFIAARR